MLFQTTQAHEQLRAKIRAFAEEEVKPIAFSLDQANEFPAEAVKKLGELGLMGIPYPKEYGGAGLDAISYAIAVEELSRVDGGTGVILSAHVSLGSWPIFAFGTEEQKKKYLVPLARGEKIGAFGLTEPNAGSDAGGTETTAVDKGDHWLLNGGKIFITNAPKADTYVVFAVTTPDIGTRGISAFIVEKGWKGFYFGDHYDKMGIRSSSTAELIFDNVEVPRENLLGKEGEGFKIAMSTLDGGRIGIAAQALGIAQGAYDAAVAYSKERIQFGKPIGFQQAISFKIADMATKLRCARFLVYSAAELKEAHAPYGMESAMAKMYASDIALEVTNDAMQIYGGAGFMKGMDVERISNRQKEIYKESGARKRACKTMADVREFQIWHMQAQEELDDLKAEKREIKDNLKLVEGCKKELQQFTMLDLVSIEEKVSNTVQVPEYPYGDERAETVMDVVENDLDAVGDMEVSVEVKANAEEYIDDKNLSEAESTDVEENMDKSVNYESFMSMSPEDMAGILGFDRIVGIDEVHSKVSSFFRDVKSYVDGNEIMDVAKLVYKGMRANFIKQDCRGNQFYGFILSVSYG